MDFLDRLDIQDHEQPEPLCACLERVGDNPDCPINHAPPFTERYARLLAAQAGQVWDELEPLERLVYIGKALDGIVALSDARETRRAETA